MNKIIEIKAAQYEHICGKITFAEFMAIIHDVIAGKY